MSCHGEQLPNHMQFHVGIFESVTRYTVIALKLMVAVSVKPRAFVITDFN